MLLRRLPAWEISDMSDSQDLRGQDLYDALMRLKPAKLAETDWAVRAGVNRGFFTNLKSADRSTRMDTLNKLLSYIDKTESDLRGLSATAAAKSDYLPTRTASNGAELAEIIQLDMSLSMGNGTHIDEYVEEIIHIFDLGYIRGFTRSHADRLRIARGIGDSMIPTLLPSDEVWVDTTQTVLNLQDKIWACSIRGGGAIKRLRIGDGRKVIVLSDNPSVPEDIVDADEVRIFGRVLRLVRDL